MKKYIYLALVALVGTSIVSTVVAPPPVGTNAASPQPSQKDHGKKNATPHASTTSENDEQEKGK